MYFEKDLIVLILTFSIFSLFSCHKNPSTPDIPPSGDTWNWEFVGVPMSDSSITGIYVHPDCDSLWYAISGRWKGLYITEDGGQTWENPLGGVCGALEIDPNNTNRIFASSYHKIYRSDDRGQTWEYLTTLPMSISSMLVSKVDNSVFAGVNWRDSSTPNGIFKSTDLGENWKYYSYNVQESGLIPWDIEEDPVNMKLYVATEIYDHPQPYNPPFLRSSDGGETWEEISGTLPWHVVKIQVHPESQDVYVLTEGAGLYKSTNFGNSWQYLNDNFWLELLIDANYPNRIFGGNHTYAGSGGGVYLSTDAGNSFDLIGLSDVVVAGLCLN